MCHHSISIRNRCGMHLAFLRIQAIQETRWEVGYLSHRVSVITGERTTVGHDHRRVQSLNKKPPTFLGFSVQIKCDYVSGDSTGVLKVVVRHQQTEELPYEAVCLFVWD